jgi:ring-1,2-phenylacetyl-CoA epoxidase subunit PaaC
VHCADANLGAFAAKVLHEAEYHFDYAARWTVRLGDGSEDEHDRVSAAVAQLWPYTAELFAADELISTLASEGVAADPILLHGRWSEQVGAVLARATLGVAPTGAWRPSGGRVGLHTGALGDLLRGMRSFHRAHPGAAW